MMESTHEKNRHQVCVVCYRKGRRPVAKKEADEIRNIIIHGYDIGNPLFPAAICDGCHLLLNRKINGHNVQFPEVDYEKMVYPRFMRSSSTAPCTCQICIVATCKAREACKLKRKRGRPAATNPVPEATIKVCAHCFAKIHRGCIHSKSDCSSRRKKVYNLSELINSPVTEQRLASKVIESAGGESIETLGPYRRETVGPTPTKPKVLFSATNLSDIQKNLSLSNQQTMHLAEDLRLASGSRRVIESNLRDKLFVINHELDNFFVEKLMLFSTETKDKPPEHFEEHVVLCNDLDGLIDKVIRFRNLDEDNTLIRIGIDGGGGFLKICLSIFDLNKPSSSKKTLAKKFKDSGVKKVFIIAVTPGVQENYVNLKCLWIKTGMDSLQRPFTIATDLKLCNILLGLMTHSSLHPCCWCNIDKNNLHKKGQQRTIGNLDDLFWNFFDARGTKKNAKMFGNAIHPSLVTGNNDIPIILIVPPPELHLLIGPVNTLYDALNNVWSGSESWLSNCNVKKTEYHGGSFAGNDSRKLLKNCDDLDVLCPEEFKPYVKTFKAFNNVVSACYSQNLETNYIQKIEEFKADYLKLGISVTPKVHAVMYHIGEFCEIKGMGLSPWSEQTTESLHHDFNQIWENYKVNGKNHPEYGQRLHQAVQIYNSKHL